MQPENLIESLADLLANLDAQRLDLAEAVALVQGQWDGLRRVGGQRADHAAALMGHLTPALRRIETFTRDCQTQIERMKTDPFGREERKIPAIRVG